MFLKAEQELHFLFGFFLTNFDLELGRGRKTSNATQTP